MYFVLLFYYDQVGFVSGIKSRSILEKKPSDVIWSNEVGEKKNHEHFRKDLPTFKSHLYQLNTYLSGIIFHLGPRTWL